jgi:hypothetical protein
MARAGGRGGDASRGWGRVAVGFAAGYGAVRVYWAAGGRWGWSACDPTRPAPAADLAGGCGAATAPGPGFWSGWGAVAGCAALLVVGLLCAGARPRPVAVTGAAWAACAVLLALSFPGHLVFEVPAGLSGRPTDWRAVAGRVALLGGGLLFAAAARRPARPHDHPTRPRPAPDRLRGWAWAACLVPVLGFTVPHGLWLLGIGMPAEQLAQIRSDLDSPALIAALLAVPALGGLASLGLARPWGQVLPAWAPLVGGRPVPRLLALVPAGIAAVALVSYGLLGLWLITADLAAGRTTPAALLGQWMAAGTEVVFLGWGVALAAATWEYARLTRCPLCPGGTPPVGDGLPTAGAGQ